MFFLGTIKPAYICNTNFIDSSLVQFFFFLFFSGKLSVLVWGFAITFSSNKKDTFKHTQIALFDSLNEPIASLI